ncbi:hypothetical protein [Phenylobacterium sp.]|uniref:hypothetical protein n=1 Tax=Phenylobacterium sp. TaxID=1871053 RepID=UPI00393A264B
MKPRAAMMGLAVAALAASAVAVPAAAQTIADAQNPLEIDVTIVNDSPYPVFTDTEAGAINCFRGGLPATTLQPGQKTSFPLMAVCDTLSGEQTFVPALHGPEQRLNLAFRVDLANPAAPVAGAANAAIAVEAQGWVAPKSWLGNQTPAAITWRIACPAGGCTAK